MLRKSLFNLLILLPVYLFSQINENKTNNIKISDHLPVNCEKKTYNFKREKYIFNLAEKKTYNIKRAKSPAKIDGVLDDKIWIDCEIGNNFSELKPKNGLTERNGLSTEVKMSFDDKYFYVAAKMFDSCPDSILKELSVRDEENKNFDAFGIYINPFNDGQIEYNFMVTAAGVQIDKKITKTDDDKTWNAVWKSAVSINQEGWIAEIAIPFSQLRFSEKNKIWSVNMIRKIRKSS